MEIPFLHQQVRQPIRTLRHLWMRVTEKAATDFMLTLGQLGRLAVRSAQIEEISLKSEAIRLGQFPLGSRR